MEDTIRIIEVNGVKLEVDMRYAKKIENYRIGDGVKILKKRYEGVWESFAAVIVGFDAFPTRPTIIIAYIESPGYNPEIKMCYFNSESRDVEISPCVNEAELVLDKNGVLDGFQRATEKCNSEILEIEKKRKYFLNNFNRYFADAYVPPTK